MKTSTAKVNSNRDLVLGLGATGLSAARFLKRQGADARFMDTRNEPPGLTELQSIWPNADVDVGSVSFPTGVDRVIASPGISDRDPIIRAARDAGVPVVSDIELFIQAAAAPVCAITGSNGKSTVTTLVSLMCEAHGHKTLAGGNLGQPALDLLAEETPDWYVLELSSFQLQRTAKLPIDVAVLLNISPDHLDWHASFDEYCEAKYRIFREAKAGVFNRDDERAAEVAGALDRAIGVSLTTPKDSDYGLREEDGHLYLSRGTTLLFDTDQLAMVGRHNQFNALAALAAGELMGLSDNAMLEVLCEFPGLPHRMQRVVRIDGVDYINDSKATNVAAAVASIESVSGQLVLIAGGDGKGGDFTQLAPALESRLRAAVLIGTDAQKIANALHDDATIVFAKDMNDAVQQAARHAVRGDTVLLAPACASFDQFKSYTHRGDAFADAARRLAA